MPTANLENEVIKDEPIPVIQENQILRSPRIFAQSSRASFIDYANPRLNEVKVVPGDDIQKAIDAVASQGGGHILLGAATYKLSDNLIIPSKVMLSGAGLNSTILDFNSTSANIQVLGTLKTSAGTISVNNNSQSVTGSSTSFTSASVGDQIMLNGAWYPIAVITNDTSLTLAIPYGDTDISGGATLIASVVNDVAIRDLTIQSSTSDLIVGQYFKNFYIENCALTSGSSAGLDLDDSANLTLRNCQFAAQIGNSLEMNNVHYSEVLTVGLIDSLGGSGAVLNTVTNSVFRNVYILNPASDGFNLTSCADMALDTCAIISAGGQGIELVSGNDNIFIDLCKVDSCTSDGIKFTATSDNSKVTNSTISSNGGYGVNIAASTCDNNAVVGSIFSSNTSGAISDSGTNTTISANQPETINKPRTVMNFQAGENLTAGDAVYISRIANTHAIDLESGSSQYLSRTDSSDLRLLNNWTVECWIRLETLASVLGYSPSIMAKESAGAGWNLRIGGDNDRIDWVANDTTRYQGTTVLTTGTYYHVAITYNGTTIKVFLNGTEELSTAYGGHSTSTAALNIGRSALATTRFFDGLIDDVRIWSVARTEAEIDANMNTELAGSETGLIAYWKLNNAYTDSGPNGYTLTDNGSPSFSTTLPFTDGPTGTIEARKTSASASSTANGFMGFVQTTTTSGNQAPVIISGIATGLSGLSVGRQYYLSNTSGAISTTAGSVTRKVGIAVSSTELNITNIW